MNALWGFLAVCAVGGLVSVLVFNLLIPDEILNSGHHKHRITEMGEQIEKEIEDLKLEDSEVPKFSHLESTTQISDLRKGRSFDDKSSKATFSSPPSLELSSKFHNDPNATLQLLIENQLSSKILVKSINTDVSKEYLKILTQTIKESTDTASVKYCLELLDSFINNFEYKLADLEPFIGLIISRIDEYSIITMTLVKLYALFKQEIIPLLKHQLEILSIEGQFIPTCKFLTLMFQLDSDTAVEMFNLDSVGLLLYNVGSNKSPEIIESGLILLSTACVDEETRKLISTKYLDLLIKGTKQNESNVKTLAALVVVKTWNFQSLDDNAITIDDLLSIFMENLNDYSIEGLAYLSMKKSVKRTLRKDSEFLIELIKKLENPDEQLYGLLVIIANLTILEEDDEVSKLKKHTQKGIDEGIEESKDEIYEFIEDLIELQVITKVTTISKMSKQSMDQVIRIMYNFTKRNESHKEMIKQGALLRILDFIGRETEYTEYKVMSYKSLTSLLTSADPHLIFGSQRSPKTAVNYLFQFLALDNITSKDQFQCLLSLTNLSVLDNGPLTQEQWDQLDDLIAQQDHPLVERATLELISNLMQHKSNLPMLFNWESPKNKKRYDLIVQLTRLPDIKSQCSAVSSLSYALTFHFIGEMLLEDERLRDNLVKIVDEQSAEMELMERTAFVLYYLVFYAEAIGKLELFKKNQVLCTALKRAIANTKDDGLLEMLNEIQSILNV
jgi:hypothetical protein